MSVKAQIDVDVVYHDQDGSTLTVGVLSDHIRPAATVGHTLSGTVSTSAVTLSAAGPLSTLAVKNTGATVLRVAGAIDVAAGRVAVLPVSTPVSVAAVSGTAEYTAVWVG
jgi:ribosomal protein S5